MPMMPEHRGPADPHDDETSWYTAQVEASTGRVPVRVIEPRGRTAGWLVWAHGGSWHRGSAQDWHHPCADLAATAGVTVASVDYRLAPQHRHPAALQDMVAALGWAARRAGADGVPVAVGGDSAGGTVAACAALVQRDRGMDLAAQVLAYPPIDPLCRAASYHRDPTAFPQAETLTAAWRSYRDNRLGSHPAHYSTPLESPDLTGAAAAIIAVGTLDPVVDDVRDYRERLLAAGVPVRYQEFAATAHGAFLTPAFVRTPEPALRHWLGVSLRAALLDPAPPSPSLR